MIYIDIFNEVGFVEIVVVVFVNCIIYIYYIEGVGGGYVLDIIFVVEYFNVLFFFMNLICFFIFNILDEYFDMLMVCYYLSKNIFEDVVFVEFCIRVEIIVVEDVFYDFGVISMMFFDF